MSGTLEGRAYARAGLLGNPSDGYFGKIIAVSVKNFSASVGIEESDRLTIETGGADAAEYSSARELVDEIRLYGYYGGVRLIKAAIKKFHGFFEGRKISLRTEPYRVRCGSTIPRQVGLGGSSAIIVAAMRALAAFHGVAIPIETFPSLVLEAERDELGINAGFMDRVIQVYEGCVYMDLDPLMIREKGHGRYEPLDPGLLPPLYLAYKTALGKESGRVLNDIRLRYEKGDPAVIDVLNSLARLGERGRQVLLERRYDDLHRMMDENFDLRSKIMAISEGNREMIRLARSLGASAKFAGSGGSIIGMYEGDEMFGRLKAELEKAGAEIIKPVIQ